MYYRGHVKSFPSSREIEILFTDGDKITHLVEDGTAVIADKAPATVHVRQHVLATWSGRWEDKYYIGFIIDESSSVYKVIFDDGDQAWYERQDLRVLPVVDRFQGKIQRKPIKQCSVELSFSFKGGVFYITIK